MPRDLRVMTYNVRQLRDDADAVAAVLRSGEPDVVALQEPPRGPLGRRRLRRLAGAAGLVPVATGGGSRTTALLVREGPPRGRSVRLPWRPGLTRRGLAIAEVGGVRVISVHLGLDAAERAGHVDRVLRLVAGAPGGCVLAGDLNEAPGGPAWQRLALHTQDLTASSGPTYPATGPRVRLDAILATGGIHAAGATVLGGDDARRASDHLPVVADLVLP